MPCFHGEDYLLEMTFVLGSRNIWEVLPSFWISFCGKKLAWFPVSSFKRATQEFHYLPSKQFETKIISGYMGDYIENFYFLSYLKFHSHRNLNFRAKSKWRDCPDPSSSLKMKKEEWWARSHTMNTLGTLENSDFLIYPLYFFLLHISSQMNKNKIQENKCTNVPY